ncbi:MAG: T9SS type A sorting domain-containing protein, partial [Elusimicrobiales bacterium]|nr:T9SS type A sorting domain-containing protein [Elusimicrobiales bacterium]
TTGVWNVVVTNPDSQSGTFLNGFTITLPGPNITSVEPSSSFAQNSVPIIVNGTHFYSGTTVKLSKTGQTDINGTSVNVINPNKLTCDFNLLGAISGQWDITVSVPGNSPAQLLNAFTIMAPAVDNMKIYQGIFDPAQGKKSYITTKIAAPGKVTVKVYDSMGRFIRTLFEGDRNAGDYSDEWNGKNKDGSTVASGVYLIRVEGPGIKTTKRVLVVK